MFYQKLLEGVSPYHLDLSEDVIFGLHCHPEIELNFCVCGSCVIVADKKEWVLKSGDLAFVKPMSPHELKKVTDNKALRLTIEMGPVLLGEQFDLFYKTACENTVFSLENPTDADTKELKMLLEETVTLLSEKPPFYNITAKGNIYKISAILLKIFAKKSAENDTADKRILNIEKIGKAINMIYNNYDQPLNLDNVSKICGFSKSNFCNTFKLITGDGFHATLNRHRVDIACIKLKELNTPIEDIALSVGFTDSKSFCRVFKKITGVNAGEYRKKVK